MIHIDCTNVKKKRGVQQALDGVTGHFAAGELNGLIGPDGAGKTTLLRLLMGLLHPDEGTVQFFDGASVLTPEDRRNHMAYMPQQQSLYGDLSIGEHLDFFRDLYQLPAAVYKEKRERLLHLTRLDKFTDRLAGQLSGGMYKKLGLMCALLQSPSVLLLDEPTNGVDPISRREFWELLYQLKQEGILVLISTAYMDEAERCGRVMLLDAGRVLMAGEPRVLLQENHADNFNELFLRLTQASLPVVHNGEGREGSFITPPNLPTVRSGEESPL